MGIEEMVGRCIRKDPVAWDEFILRYQNLVRRTVYYKLYKTGARAPRNDVEDIVQEVFLMLWRDNKLAKLRDISRLKAWLSVVTINQTADYRRRQYKREAMTASLNERICEDKDTVLEDAIPSNQPDPAIIAATEEIISCLEERMMRLGANQKKVLMLKIYGNKKQYDIAAIMNLPTNTVASLIRRAKIKVRDSIMKECYT